MLWNFEWSLNANQITDFSNMNLSVPLWIDSCKFFRQKLFKTIIIDVVAVRTHKHITYPAILVFLLFCFVGGMHAITTNFVETHKFKFVLKYMDLHVMGFSFPEFMSVIRFSQLFFFFAFPAFMFFGCWFFFFLFVERRLVGNLSEIMNFVQLHRLKSNKWTNANKLA